MIILACEVLRPELSLLTERFENPPEIIFLSQRLHDNPDKLRQAVQEAVDEIEASKPEEQFIGLGYGLCGRGLTGVSSKRATLLIPRLHDCIPLLLGPDPDNQENSSRDGKTFWSSPGWLDNVLVEFYLTDSRFKKYAEKVGEQKARKMVAAEDALLDNYEKTCHIHWPEIGENWVELAKNVAKKTGLDYCEKEGKSDYLLALLNGGQDDSLFLRIEPGMTIDMAVDGRILAVKAQSHA